MTEPVLHHLQLWLGTLPTEQREQQLVAGGRAMLPLLSDGMQPWRAVLDCETCTRGGSVGCSAAGCHFNTGSTCGSNAQVLYHCAASILTASKQEV